jgi:hypothetical protein
MIRRLFVDAGAVATGASAEADAAPNPGAATERSTAVR